MIAVLAMIWISATRAAPPLDRPAIAPYLCRFRDGDDVRDVLKFGRIVASANLDQLKLDRSVRVPSLNGVNLPLYGVLKVFGQLSGYDLRLSPGVARMAVTFNHPGPLSLDEMAELMWREFARLNVMVLDDGYDLRVLARCR